MFSDDGSYFFKKQPLLKKTNPTLRKGGKLKPSTMCDVMTVAILVLWTHRHRNNPLLRVSQTAKRKNQSRTHAIRWPTHTTYFSPLFLFL